MNRFARKNKETNNNNVLPSQAGDSHRTGKHRIIINHNIIIQQSNCTQLELDGRRIATSLAWQSTQMVVYLVDV